MANGVLLVRSQVPLSLWARFSDDDQDPPTTRAEFVDSSEVIICVVNESLNLTQPGQDLTRVDLSESTHA